jgi:cytidyltransferase-like protein
MNSPKKVVVAGGFDDARARDLRFLQEAGKLGEVTVLLWTDEAIEKFTGKKPKFSLAERLYFLNAVRYVNQVVEFSPDKSSDELPANVTADIWANLENSANPNRAKFAKEKGIEHHLIKNAELNGFPEPPPMPGASGRKKIVVTGCYDWFHSGHVRFCEEVSSYGDLYVIVGHDANIRLLKGEGHPLLSQDERRYVVGSIKFVKQSLISTGDGWLDADPEIKRLKPDIYAVNEDGDKGGKREYCEKNGIEYLVLKRTPAPGLPKRSSTDLRGF